MGQPNTSLRVLIADYEPEVRRALQLVCKEGLGLTIVGEAADSAQLLSSIKVASPDILLLEWGLPGMTPSELMAALQTEESLNIVVIGGRPEIRAEALRAGAKGFIYKGNPPDELLNLLRTFLEV